MGRSVEVKRVCAALCTREARLLTLTGPGGAGKTRLAIAAASEAAGSFSSGTHLVELEPVRDPSVVPLAIAQALHVPLNPTLDPLERVLHALEGQTLLLVVDNCEHLPGVGAVLADLLAHADGLSVLATSREPLGVRWEHVLPVRPFELPDPSTAQIDHLYTHPATTLFAQRARAIRPEFRLGEDNVRDIAAICARLDGLPLAIELAAAGVEAFEPTQLLRQLDYSVLALPVAGGHDLPPRQRTLRAVAAWSYSLLDNRERALFTRLAVCAGGCTLEMARALDSGGALRQTDHGPDERPLELVLASLVRKSLLYRASAPSGVTRYRMLETIRAFAAEHLAAAGDLASARAAHLEHVLAQVECAAAEIQGRETTGAIAALDRLEEELENVRAALSAAAEQPYPSAHLRLCVALSEFWELRGYQREGLRWAEAALARAPASPLKAITLGVAGRLARQCSAYARGQELFLAQLDTARTVGEQIQIAEAQHNLGVTARARRELAVAAAAFTEALEGRRAAGDARGYAVTLSHLGDLAREDGQLVRARTMLTEALAAQAAMGDRRNQTVSLHMLAAVEFADGETRRAAALHEECLSLQRQLGDRRGVAVTYRSMCAEAVARGDVTGALDLCAAGIRACEEVGERWNGAACLAALALVLWQAGVEEDRRRAACLLGAAEALRRGSAAPLLHRAGVAATLARILGEASLPPYAAAWARGQGLTFAEARTAALDAIQAARRLRLPQSLVGAARREAEPLTPREWEVARLVTQGYTDRQVAEALVISTATATVHVKHILGKLGFTSRAQIAAWAAGQQARQIPHLGDAPAANRE